MILLRAFCYCGLIHRASANAVFNALFRLLRWASNSFIDIDVKALPLDWMDESKSYERGLLRHGSKGIAHGPHYVGRAQSTASVCLPDIRYYAFERARVSATSSSVILDDRQVIVDRGLESGASVWQGKLQNRRFRLFGRRLLRGIRQNGI